MRGVRSRPSALHSRISLLVAIAICFAVLAPSAAFASTELGSGDAAVIARANGDNVRLRMAPDSSSAIVGRFPEGTSVQIAGGIVNDGQTNWYPVTIQGQSGYIAAEYVWPESQANAPDFPADSSGSGAQTTAWIFNTNGDGIRCRDAASTTGAVLHRFVEGDSVILTGQIVNGWYPAICDGKAGFVAADYITFNSPTPTAGSTKTSGQKSTPTPQPAAVTAASAETGANGVVTGTNGDGVRCRTSRSLSASIITVLPEGATVPLRSEIGGNWTEVTCAGTDGWVATEFLSSASSSSSGASSSGSSLAGSPATITGTNGDGVRCRDKNSFDSNVYLVLPENANITLRGDQNGDWMPVYCSSKKEKGWVYAQYVTVGSSSSGGSSSGGSSSGGTTSSGAADGFLKGQSVVVANTNGDGVRLRTAASTSASVVMVLPEGTVAKVRSNGSGDWLAITYNSSKGFIYATYLELAPAGGVGGGQPTPTPAPVDGLGDGDHAAVTSTLNFRTGASLTSSIIGVANQGDVVLITGKSKDGFYPVQYLEQDGWMGGDYLAWTDAALTVAPLVSGNAGSAPATKQGQAMVDYAMKYLGYPYVWATHGPDTFDCSGFTYWVALHTLKKDIGAGTWLQVGLGTPVQYGDLKPGDLVFFQNTYTWGLSHVGIYIGNNQFIHAENENTGVKISSLSSPYYASRWYGARRIAN